MPRQDDDDDYYDPATGTMFPMQIAFPTRKDLSWKDRKGYDNPGSIILVHEQLFFVQEAFRE